MIDSVNYGVAKITRWMMPRARDERFGTRRKEQKPKVSMISGAAKTRPGKPIFILSKETDFCL